jgi:hypothetical protein
MKRSVKLSLVTAFAALALGAGTAAADHNCYEDGPPPVRIVNAAPRAGYVWVQGRYNFDYASNQWLWYPGHYERSRAGYVWIDGRWDNRGGSWIWVDGSWNRDQAYGRDYDGDRGDRDRYDDRDRDHRRFGRGGGRRHHRGGGWR